MKFKLNVFESNKQDELYNVRGRLVEKVTRLKVEIEQVLWDLKTEPMRRLNQCGVLQNTQMIEVLAGQYNTLIETLEYIKKMENQDEE